MWEFISEHCGVNSNGVGISWLGAFVMSNLFWITIVTLILKAKLIRREKSR